MRVLIVEDEHLVARDIERILCQAGYIVTSIASSAEDAVLKAAEDRPDLVLMDIMLQKSMSGIEAAREIRRRFDIPIIFITAYADEETIEAAKTAEPFGYVLKPLNEKELRASIELAWHKFAREKRVKERVENRYQLLMENITEGIAILDPNNIIAFVNDKLLRQRGYARSEVIGHAVEEFIEKDSVLASKKKAVGKNDKGKVCELRLKTKAGTPFYAVISSEPLFDEEEKSAGRIAIITDITDRLRFEEELNRSREELRSLS